MVERRAGAETGVKRVQAVSGDAIWKAEEEGRWSLPLLEAAIGVQPASKGGNLRERLGAKAAFYLIDYRDGLQACVAMANGVARQFSFAAKLKGNDKPQATLFALEEESPYRHFAYLLRAIEQTIVTGKPAYPAERTLLTTGILDRAMHSLADGGKPAETPELAIEYKAVDWPHAPGEPGAVKFDQG